MGLQPLHENLRITLEHKWRWKRSLNPNNDDIHLVDLKPFLSEYQDSGSYKLNDIVF